MKKETAEAKFAALFGLQEQTQELKIKSTGKLLGVTEDEIQKYREAQGLWYFLQAPALFTMKRCKRESCGEIFAVSRKYVAYCSHECIRLSLLDQGIKWSKAGDFEVLAQDPDVWEGNEPIWIRQSVLEKLEEMASLRDNPITSSALFNAAKLNQEPILESSTNTEPLPTSSIDSTTPSLNTNSPNITIKKKTRRVSSFKA